MAGGFAVAGAGALADATGAGLAVGVPANVIGLAGVVVGGVAYATGGIINAVGIDFGSSETLTEARKARPVAPPRDRIGEAGLPKSGDKPFVPRKNWRQTEPLDRPQDGRGYRDCDKNIWRKGPPHHFPDQPYEWDVTSPDGGHINVGNDGSVR